MKLYSKLLAKRFLFPFTISFSHEKSKFVYLFSFKYKVKNLVDASTYFKFIFQVLQCTYFLSKFLTLVEFRNNNNDEVYIFKLIFNTGINRALCFTRKQVSTIKYRGSHMFFF